MEILCILRRELKFTPEKRFAELYILGKISDQLLAILVEVFLGHSLSCDVTPTSCLVKYHLKTVQLVRARSPRTPRFCSFQMQPVSGLHFWKVTFQQDFFSECNLLLSEFLVNGANSYDYSEVTVVSVNGFICSVRRLGKMVFASRSSGS